MSQPPALTVVLFTDESFAALRPLLRALRLQTVARRLEVVIVSPKGSGLDVEPPEMEPFHSWRLLTCPGPPVRGGLARGIGARGATAPIIAFCEDHSFPEPSWAETLLSRHTEPWVAVAPQIVNGNPDLAASWAMLGMTFGPYVSPVQAGEVSELPWHNTSYKRDALMGLGEKLDLLLEAEGQLQEVLRSRGGHLYLEPAAKTRHVNISRLSTFPVDAYWGGRLYAAVRSERWSLTLRLVYAAASPLIWVKRLRHSLRQVIRMGAAERVLPRLLPMIVLCEGVAALGEAVSYLTGTGPSADRKGSLEVRRYRHLASNDPARAMFADEGEGRG